VLKVEVFCSILQVQLDSAK